MSACENIDGQCGDSWCNCDQKRNSQRELPAPAGSALLRRLQNHQAAMAPHQKERYAGKLLIEATAEIQRLIGICENQRLRKALESIIGQQPCCEGGGCFYPMHDGEGNYIGEQNVDPLGVIQGMVQTAHDALSPNAPPATETQSSPSLE